MSKDPNNSEKKLSTKKAGAIAFVVIIVSLVIYIGENNLRERRKAAEINKSRTIPYYEIEKYISPMDQSEKIREIEQKISSGNYELSDIEILIDAYNISKTADKGEKFFINLLKKEPNNYLILFATGWLQLTMKKFKEAEQNIEKAMDLKSDFIPAWQKYADLHILQKRLKKAEALQLKVLQMAEKANDRKSLANGKGNLAQIYMLKKNSILAQKYQEEAIDLHRELDMKKDLAIDYIMMGRIFIDQGSVNRAYEYLNSALRLARELNDRILEVKVLAQIAEFYRQQRDFNKFFYYLKMANDLIAAKG